MSLGAQCVWDMARGASVAALSVLLAWPLRALVGTPPKRRFRWTWALLLVPFLTPVVLVGYAWSNYSLSLVRHPALNELLYDLLLLARVTPVAVLVLHFAPSGFSREAIHCRRLLDAGNSTRWPLRERITFLLHGEPRKACVAFAIVFVLVFSEFEMASLLFIRTWTVSLFDAQTGGLALTESLKLVRFPMACEGALLLMVMGILFGGPDSIGGLSPERPKLPGPATRCAGWTWLVSAAVLETAVPVAVLFGGLPAGFTVLVENPGLIQDVVTSVLFAAAAATLAYLVAGWLSTRAGSALAPKRRLFAAFLLSIPGLLGALLLALLVLSLFQFTALRSQYDTPLPLVLTLTLLLMPFAVLLRVLLHVLRPSESFHAARLLGKSSEPAVRHAASRLAYEERGRGRFLVAGLLFFWAYFEVVASALLAPAGRTPVFVRLYNMMHYGRIAGLSAMVLAALAVPLVLLWLAVGARGVFARWIAHG